MPTSTSSASAGATPSTSRRTPRRPADDYAPAFSPDGTLIVFRSERAGGGIFVMGAMGESARRLTDFGHDPAWSPGGDAIVVSEEFIKDANSRASMSAGLWRVALPGGERSLLTKGDAVQPHWSPHGHRIVVSGFEEAKSGPAGRRRIRLSTIPAGGVGPAGGAVPLTDGYLDGHPVWSPDGRFVYFMSDRGGTRNVWRVAVDEMSGRPLREPEPVTVPTAWVSGLSLSRDGRQIAFGSADPRSTLYVADFDPASGVGTPKSILRSELIAGSHISPDGEWVAFTSLGVRESLFVMRSDGSDFRQLTDDKELTRGPHWSPSGREVAFFRSLAGSVDIWAVRPDGSGLRPLSKAGGVLLAPIWSPDGTRIAAVRVPGGPCLIDVARPTPDDVPKQLPVLGDGLAFVATSWSSDGRSLAGSAFRADGSEPEGLYVYSLDSGRYRRVGERGNWPAFLNDGRRLLVSQPQQPGSGATNVRISTLFRTLALFDIANGQTRSLLPIPVTSYSLSRDNRRLAFVESTTEGDIWLMTLSGPGLLR